MLRENALNANNLVFHSQREIAGVERLTNFGNALSPYASGAFVGSIFGGSLAEIRVVAISQSMSDISQNWQNIHHIYSISKPENNKNSKRFLKAYATEFHSARYCSRKVRIKAKTAFVFRRFVCKSYGRQYTGCYVTSIHLWHEGQSMYCICIRSKFNYVLVMFWSKKGRRNLQLNLSQKSSKRDINLWKLKWIYNVDVFGMQLTYKNGKFRM